MRYLYITLLALVVALALPAQTTTQTFTTTTTLSIPTGCKDTVVQSATQIVVTQTCTAIFTPPKPLTGNATITLPQATLGKPYSVNVVSLIAATGGVPPYHYSKGVGFPVWLSISPAGILSGTPTATGAFVITIVTTDSGGSSATSFATTVTAIGR